MQVGWDQLNRRAQYVIAPTLLLLLLLLVHNAPTRWWRYANSAGARGGGVGGEYGAVVKVWVWEGGDVAGDEALPGADFHGVEVNTCPRQADGAEGHAQALLIQRCEQRCIEGSVQGYGSKRALGRGGGHALVNECLGPLAADADAGNKGPLRCTLSNAEGKRQRDAVEAGQRARVQVGQRACNLGRGDGLLNGSGAANAQHLLVARGFGEGIKGRVLPASGAGHKCAGNAVRITDLPAGNGVGIARPAAAEQLWGLKVAVCYGEQHCLLRTPYMCVWGIKKKRGGEGVCVCVCVCMYMCVWGGGRRE